MMFRILKKLNTGFLNVATLSLEAPLFSLLPATTIYIIKNITTIIFAAEQNLL